MNLIERIKEASEKSTEAHKIYYAVLENNDGMTANEHTRICNTAWRKMRDVLDMQRAIEYQADEIADIYAQQHGLSAPKNRVERKIIWQEIGDAWTKYDVKLRLPDAKILDLQPRLDNFQIAGKELSAAEAMQWETAAGKALEWLDEQRDAGEINSEQYANGRDFVFNIALDAHQTSDSIIDELAQDYLKKQQGDWERPIGDILDEWYAEQREDKPNI